MENLIYVAVVILYFLYQAQQGRKVKQQQEEARRRAEEEPGRQVREVTPPTLEERMKDIFREVEMKNKPYARPDKTTVKGKVTPPAVQTIKKPQPVVPVKKKPTPFLNVDMSQEEVLPEGTWTPMAEERFSKSGYDYNKAAPETAIRKVNLRDAVIGKIILDRPEW